MTSSGEIAFPLEFIVEGTPVSLQAKRAETRADWRRRVQNASRTALPDFWFMTEARLAVTILYFPLHQMQGDIDNIVKPILDALCKDIYYDDRQVERVWVQKFEPERVVPFQQPSIRLADAIERSRPLVYIRMSDNLVEGFS